jgi:hypothetical protein
MWDWRVLIVYLLEREIDEERSRKGLHVAYLSFP